MRPRFQPAKNGDTFVVIFDDQITGKDESHLKSYRKFIDYAFLNKATFVTISELVNIYRRKNPAIIFPNIIRIPATRPSIVAKSRSPEMRQVEERPIIAATVQNVTNKIRLHRPKGWSTTNRTLKACYVNENRQKPI